jgi:hypothetical protein
LGKRDEEVGIGAVEDEHLELLRCLHGGDELMQLLQRAEVGHAA